MAIMIRENGDVEKVRLFVNIQLSVYFDVFLLIPAFRGAKQKIAQSQQSETLHSKSPKLSHL